MNFLSGLDPNLAALLPVACVVLCVLGVVLILGAQVLGIAANLVGTITGLISGVTANPVSCCGCLTVIGLLALCGGGYFVLTQFLASCGTNPTNFCSLFGR